MPPAIPTVAVASGTAAFSTAVLTRLEPELAVALRARLLNRPSTRSEVEPDAARVADDPDDCRAADDPDDLRAADDPDDLRADVDPDDLRAAVDPREPVRFAEPEDDRAAAAGPDFARDPVPERDERDAVEPDLDVDAVEPDLDVDAVEPDLDVFDRDPVDFVRALDDGLAALDPELPFDADPPLLDRLERRRDADAEELLPEPDDERFLDVLRRGAPPSFSTAMFASLSRSRSRSAWRQPAMTSRKSLLMAYPTGVTPTRTSC